MDPIVFSESTSSLTPAAEVDIPAAGLTFTRWALREFWSPLPIFISSPVRVEAVIPAVVVRGPSALMAPEITTFQSDRSTPPETAKTGCFLFPTDNKEPIL